MAKTRPAVFVGSSSEGLAIARAIQLELDRQCRTRIWTQGVFGLSQGTLEALEQALDESDFAVLVLTADDLIKSRGKKHQVARDNVLFELGLFMGRLGRGRTFMVYDRTNPPKIPSDLAGITPATFEPHDPGDLQSALGAACTQIGIEIETLGCRSRTSPALRELCDERITHWDILRQLVFFEYVLPERWQEIAGLDRVVRDTMWRVYREKLDHDAAVECLSPFFGRSKSRKAEVEGLMMIQMKKSINSRMDHLSAYFKRLAESLTPSGSRRSSL